MFSFHSGFVDLSKKMKTVIIYSEIEWKFLEQRHHFLARFFKANGFKVIFVQRVLNRIPTFLEMVIFSLRKINSFMKLRKENSEFTPDHSGIHLTRSHFLPSFNLLFRWYNQVYWILRHKQLQDGAILYSFSNNPAVHGYGRTGANYSIFDVIHNWWSFPWHGDAHRKLTNETLPAYDKIITDSPIIQNWIQGAGFNVSLMLPGVAGHWFEDVPACESGDPKVCFFGNLRGNSDLEFVQVIQDKFGVQIFGRIDASAGKLGDLFASVIEVPNSQLPHELSRYNMVLLPYRNDEFSLTISPAKYFECLASGLLVVTRSQLSHLPGANDYLFVWKQEWDTDEFTSHLRRRLALQPNVRSKQIAFARKHSWESRFDANFAVLLNKDIMQ